MPRSPVFGGLNHESEDKVKTSLRRLHNNLGHPTNQQLIRVLKHGGASEAALNAARAFQCDQCLAQKSPKVALPAQVHRTTEFVANCCSNLPTGVIFGLETGVPRQVGVLGRHASGDRLRSSPSESARRLFLDSREGWRLF